MSKDTCHCICVPIDAVWSQHGTHCPIYKQGNDALTKANRMAKS